MRGARRLNFKTYRMNAQQTVAERIAALKAELATIEPKEQAAYTVFKQREAALAVEPAKETWLALYRKAEALRTIIEALEHED